MASITDTHAPLRKLVASIPSEDILKLFELPPVIVACGKDAREACEAIDATEAIAICHPSRQGLNRYPTNRPKHVRGLRLAAQLSSGQT